MSMSRLLLYMGLFCIERVALESPAGHVASAQLSRLPTECWLAASYSAELELVPRVTERSASWGVDEEQETALFKKRSAVGSSSMRYLSEGKRRDVKVWGRLMWWATLSEISSSGCLRGSWPSPSGRACRAGHESLMWSHQEAPPVATAAAALARSRGAHSTESSGTFFRRPVDVTG